MKFELHDDGLFAAIRNQIKNIIRYSFLILLPILLSCDPVKESYLHPDLAPYYYKFRTEASIRGYDLPDKDIVMEFETGKPRFGYCKWDKNSVHIWIDSLNFYQDDELNRETTIFHELGHGLLNRHHIDFNDDPKSLMNENSYGFRRGYRSNREEFLNELFQ